MRRKLRLPSSSSSDGDRDEPPVSVSVAGSGIGRGTGAMPFSGVENPSSPPPSPPSEFSPQEEVSDEFIDVEDDFPPPPSPPPPSDPDFMETVDDIDTAELEPPPSDCPIAETLRVLGARPRRQWLDSCIQVLRNSLQGFDRLTVVEQADLCFGEFLLADMNVAGGGGLPPNIHSMHRINIGGPFILQVDEIVNISSNLRERYKEAPATIKRCLKLSMTDGIQRLFGIEYRPMKELMVLAPAGLKVAIQNVHIGRGLLLLVPEVLEVLGGSVEYLEASRQRLVNEVNKPPRGRRRQRGEEVPSLVTRARLAAWPPEMISDPMQPSTTSSENITQHQQSTIGETVNRFQTAATITAVEERVGMPSSLSSAPNISSSSANHGTLDARANTNPGQIATTAIGRQETMEMPQDPRSSAWDSSSSFTSAVDARTNTDLAGDTLTTNTSNSQSASRPSTGHANAHISRTFAAQTAMPPSLPFTTEEPANVIGKPSTSMKPRSDRNQLSNTLASDTARTAMRADSPQPTEHPYALVGENEIPFAYMAYLQASVSLLG